MARKKTSSRSARSPEVPVAQTRICVIYGVEEMQKREQFHALRLAMEEAHGEVETVVYDGESVELAAVFDELRSYGLMQQYKLVVVDHADSFTTTHRAALERYAAEPVDTATLVLRSVKWNKGKLDKLIEKQGFVHKCDPMSEAKATKWLQDRAASAHDCKLDSKLAGLLVMRLGVDLMRLDAELAKLVMSVKPGQPLTRDLIDEMVGRSSDEDAWAVQEAVLESLAAGLSGGGSGRSGSSRRGGTPAGAAIEKVHELVNVAGQPDMLVAYFVADMMRKLYLARQMKEQGVSDSDIGREMKLWGPRQGAFMAILRRLNEDDAARLLDDIVTLDARAKSGFGETMRNLERFCATLADTL